MTTSQDLRSGVLVPHLRAERLRQLLSQEKLAHRAGVSRPTVIAAEAGRPIRADNVRRMARALKVDWRILLEPVDGRPNP